jgi:hypothetical protein
VGRPTAGSTRAGRNQQVGGDLLIDLVAGFTAAVDRHGAGSNQRTDLGEMARLAAAEIITALVGLRMPTFFETSSDDVRKELGRFATRDRFGDLAQLTPDASRD